MICPLPFWERRWCEAWPCTSHRGYTLAPLVCSEGRWCCSMQKQMNNLSAIFSMCIMLLSHLCFHNSEMYKDNMDVENVNLESIFFFLPTNRKNLRSPVLHKQCGAVSGLFYSHKWLYCLAICSGEFCCDGKCISTEHFFTVNHSKQIQMKAAYSTWW